MSDDTENKENTLEPVEPGKAETVLEEISVEVFFTKRFGRYFVAK